MTISEILKRSNENAFRYLEGFISLLKSQNMNYKWCFFYIIDKLIENHGNVIISNI